MRRKIQKTIAFSSNLVYNNIVKTKENAFYPLTESPRSVKVDKGLTFSAFRAFGDESRVTALKVL